MSELNKIYKEVSGIKEEASSLLELADAFNTVGNTTIYNQLTVIAECLCEYSDNILKHKHKYIDNAFNNTISQTADIISTLIDNEDKREV